MKTLAIDIGGTKTRFAQYHQDSFKDLDDIEIFKLETQSNDIHCFNDLLDHYRSKKPSSFLDIQSYETLSFSVPGPVYNDICLPPNIPWEINVKHLREKQMVFMINDFAAQAYACLIPEVSKQLITIKEGTNLFGNTIGIIGAGTGIGHCTIVNNQIFPSEAGHATFSFINKEEKTFEEFLKQKLNVDYCVTDNIVNGRGICFIHEFLTGERLSAEEIFNDNKHKETINLFSRYYARTARNYCLTNVIDNELIISGGLAAKNPQIVQSDIFLEEFMFLTAEAYKPLLENITIKLNKKDEIGTHGAAYYALLHLK